jgi:hypothetical protein
MDLAAQQQACKQHMASALLQTGHSLHPWRCFEGADPFATAVVVYVLYHSCGVPQSHDRFFQADLQQEQEEGSVTSAKSLRALVAASVMTTVTALPTNATMHVRVRDLVILHPVTHHGDGPV